MTRYALIALALVTSAAAYADDAPRTRAGTVDEAPSEDALLAELDALAAELEESTLLALEEAESVREPLDGDDPTIYAMSVSVCHPALGCYVLVEDERCCADAGFAWGVTQLGNGFTVQCFD